MLSPFFAKIFKKTFLFFILKSLRIQGRCENLLLTTEPGNGKALKHKYKSPWYKHIGYGWVFLLLLSSANVQAWPTQTEYEFNVQQTTLGEALDELVKVSGAQLIFPNSLANATGINQVVGRYTLKQALDKLLDGTEFSGGLTNGGMIVISVQTDSEKQQVKPELANNTNKAKKLSTKPSVIASIIAMLFGTGVNAQAVDVNQVADDNAAVESKTQKENPTWERITVTATKRPTFLEDTSMSISVVGADEIEKRNIEGMTDYLNSLPGVNVFSQGPGQNTVVIRGMTISPTTDGTSTTSVAGVYLGEVPLSGLGFEGSQSDIKLVDMQRSEVLRGPQGTLYGSGAMSGVVRNIPINPDLNIVEGHVSGGFSNTAEEGGNNISLKAAINIPIIDDKFAVRAVAYNIDNSGYYKNIAASDSAFIADIEGTYGGVVTSEMNEEVGGNKTSGMRISALWQASDNVELNLMHLSQKSEQDGRGTETSLDEKWSQRSYQLLTDPLNESSIADSERVEDDVSITNLTANIDLNSLSIVSSTSLADADAFIKYNNSSLAFLGLGYPAGTFQEYENESFSQEIRLVSEFDGNWQFITGLFYSDLEQSANSSLFFNGEPELNAALPGEVFLLKGNYTKSIQQKAVFGEVYYNATDKLKFIAGGRAFNYQYDQQLDGIFFISNSELSTDTAADESDTSGKLSLEYTPNDDTLFYATWSQGFRLGYPTADAFLVCDADSDGLIDGGNVPINGHVINSDSVNSLEVGGKLSLLDNHLQVSTALFNLNWTDVPVTVAFDRCSATVNAGEATSKGIEFSLSYRVNESLSLDFNTSYINAELDKDAANFGGEAGDRLPGSPRFNASLGMEYRFALAGYDSYLRADYSYSGDYYTDLKQTSRKLGDYGILNANLGIAMDNFDISLYAHNLTNEDSFTWVSLLGRESGSRLKPRTLGVNLTYHF